MIEALNATLTAEPIGIDLYFVHAEVCVKAQPGLIRTVGTDRDRAEQLEE